MDNNELVKEFGIEIAIEKIAQKITELTEQYKVNKNKDLKNQIVDLMKDRDKIYQNDKDVIMKYCK